MNDDIVIKNGSASSGPWKILTIIFGLTTVAAAIVAGYFFISNKNASAELSKLRQEAGAAAIESTPLASIKTLGFDDGSITNSLDNTSYTFHFEDPFNIFSSVVLSADGKTLTARLNTADVARIYGSAPVAEATITFPQRVVDVFLYGAGQAAGGEVLLFLMEDGTVEYMPMDKAIAAGELKSYGMINNLSNIVKFYYADTSVADPENPGSRIGGAVTTLAQSINGTIYDLQPILKSILNPETTTDCPEDADESTDCVQVQTDDSEDDE